MNNILDAIEAKIVALGRAMSAETKEWHARLASARHDLWLAYPSRVHEYYTGLGDNDKPTGFVNKNDTVCGYSLSTPEHEIVRAKEMVVREIRIELAHMERRHSMQRLRIEGLEMAYEIAKAND